MNNYLTESLIAQLGVTGLFIFFSVRAIIKLYSDIRVDVAHREATCIKREEALMRYLDSKSVIDRDIASTLKNVDQRIFKLEKYLEGACLACRNE